MLGKLIATVLVLGALFFGAVWFFTGQTPSQFIHSITATKTTDDLSTGNAKDLTYSYQVVVGKNHETHRFDVAVHVVKRTSNQLCYTYKIADIKQGDPSFIRDFMYGYQGYTAENQVLCTDLKAKQVDLSTYFTDPGRTGDVAINSASGTGKAYVENGVLRSLDYSYTVDYNGEKVPVQLSVRLATTATSQQAVTTKQQIPEATTQQVPSSTEPSSANVKTLYYRFTWKVAKMDIATGKPTGDYTATTYDIRVDVAKRAGDRVCLKYSIVGGDEATASQAMAQLWPYPPGKTVCTMMKDSATQIPYFLFPETMTKTQTFSGQGAKGVATISHGIIKHLEIDGTVSVEDENGTETTIPMKLVIDLVKAEK